MFFLSGFAYYMYTTTGNRVVLKNWFVLSSNWFNGVCPNELLLQCIRTYIDIICMYALQYVYTYVCSHYQIMVLHCICTAYHVYCTVHTYVQFILFYISVSLQFICAYVHTQSVNAVVHTRHFSCGEEQSSF